MHYTQLPLKYLITFKIGNLKVSLCSERSDNGNRDTCNNNLFLSERSSVLTGETYNAVMLQFHHYFVIFLNECLILVQAITITV